MRKGSDKAFGRAQAGGQIGKDFIRILEMIIRMLLQENPDHVFAYIGQLDTDLDPEAASQALIMSLLGLLTLVRAGITDLRPGIDATFRRLGGRPAESARRSIP